MLGFERSREGFLLQRSVPTMSFRQRLEHRKGFWACAQAQPPNSWFVFLLFLCSVYIAALLRGATEHAGLQYRSCQQRSVKDPHCDRLP